MARGAMNEGKKMSRRSMLGSLTALVLGSASLMVAPQRTAVAEPMSDFGGARMTAETEAWLLKNDLINFRLDERSGLLRSQFRGQDVLIDDTVPGPYSYSISYERHLKLSKPYPPDDVTILMVGDEVTLVKRSGA